MIDFAVDVFGSAIGFLLALGIIKLYETIREKIRYRTRFVKHVRRTGE